MEAQQKNMMRMRGKGDAERLWETGGVIVNRGVEVSRNSGVATNHPSIPLEDMGAAIIPLAILPRGV